MMKMMALVGAAAAAMAAVAEFEVPGEPKDVPELKATSLLEWETVERPRLLKTFMEEEYGVRPVERPADLAFAETAAPETCLGGKAIRKRVRATYSGPGGAASFDFSVWIPKADHPVPVFVHSSPRPAETADDVNGPRPVYWLPVEDIVSRGYAVVAYCNQEVALDWNLANVATGGVFKAFGNADLKNREPTEWGILSAWAWGMSRIVDWIEKEPRLDAKRIASVGLSRNGKTSLLAGVTDQRFALVISCCSGCCGAKLNHMECEGSETLKAISIAASWFAPNFMKYVGHDRDGRMPFDQHQFLALVAPRLLYVSSATEDAWAGPRGEFAAASLASKVWNLYGKAGLVQHGFPKPDMPLQAGSIGYHLRTGLHDITRYDWQCYMDFADGHGWNVPRRKAASVPVLVPMPREVNWNGGMSVNPVITDRKDASVPKEGYRLEVAADGITVTSSDAAGAFYARQTLRQLAEITKRGAVTNYPCCTISDSPAYPWRGVLIDEGRHFQGKEMVKRTIDMMAYHKLNTLHWHLTEDQGWRIDVPGMPELAKYGSVRAQSPCHGARLKHLGKFRYASTAMDGAQYGPFFYTRADLEEVVAYARARHVTIVPEIELPGHSKGALAAFPELACFPENINPRMADSDWGITTDVLCVGNDKTLRFLEKVLDYVCEVFPGEVIHIGGDECPTVAWEKCPKCQARMKAEGMTKPGELQNWITRKVADYLAKKGRRVMGWDEILNGDVPQTAIGQSWRTQNGNGAGNALVKGSDGAARGYDMVMTPHTECYYSYDAGLEVDPFTREGSPLSLARAYAFDPCKGVSDGDRAHVLGSEACIWGEYTWNLYDFEWKLWPRGCAMAEILWTDPQPRDFGNFRSRVEVHRKRLMLMGVNCQPLE